MRPRIHPMVLMLLSGLICLFLAASARAQAPAAGGWSAYGHDAGGSHFSRLTQINRSNVSRLKVAWVYHTGALQPVDLLECEGGV